MDSLGYQVCLLFAYSYLMRFDFLKFLRLATYRKLCMYFVPDVYYLVHNCLLFL